ncbi:hypothetical protein [Mycobacterium sp. URHB0021]|jgi:hypothetical protein
MSKEPRPDKAGHIPARGVAKEGRADEPIHYEVTRHHDGRSFAGLTITARQNRGVSPPLRAEPLMDVNNVLVDHETFSSARGAIVELIKANIE